MRHKPAAHWLMAKKRPVRRRRIIFSHFPSRSYAAIHPRGLLRNRCGGRTRSAFSPVRSAVIGPQSAPLNPMASMETSPIGDTVTSMVFSVYRRRHLSPIGDNSSRPLRREFRQTSARNQPPAGSTSSRIRAPDG
jgi:hypothetical protein